MVCFFVVAGLLTGCKTSQAQDQTPKGNNVVVLELFTSQGCSSCPPADRVLTAIGDDPALKGKVIPLAYHVDYWDYIGWKDPFASELWSNRQRDYGHRAFDTRRIYTPQLVVNGRTHLVGSNKSGVMDHIAKASRDKSTAEVSGAATRKGDVLSITGNVKRTAASGAPARVLIIIYENDLTTRVTRGENTGRTLVNDHIVRKIIGAGKLDGSAGASATVNQAIALDKAWTSANVGAVILVQDPKTMSILGAAAL